MLMRGADNVVETFVDLRISEVSRENGHHVPSKGNGARNGVEGIPLIPTTSTKEGKRGNDAVKATMACGAHRETIVVKRGVRQFLTLRWRRGGFAPFFTLGAPESNGRSPSCKLDFGFASSPMKVGVDMLFVKGIVWGNVLWEVLLLLV